MGEHAALDIWSAHIAACPECRRAVRMRFAGALPAAIAAMAAKWCPLGRPLYEAFLAEADAPASPRLPDAE